MPEWTVWTIVAGIGLLAAILIHALMRQSQGAALMVALLFGIAGALLAAWILPTLLHMLGMTAVEQRYIWAAVGGLVFSLIYELTSAGTRKSRILMPAPGR